MTTNESTSPTEDSPDEDEDEDFATIEMPKGGVVIYATADHSQWIQSDTAVDLEDSR